MANFPFTPEQRQWIDALKSGKYAQGEGYLRWGNYFCCLGVACDIFGTQWVENDGVYWTPGGDDKLPPENVWKGKLKLRGSDGNASDGNANDKGLDGLVNLNDIGYSFQKIAEILEKYPTDYFTNLDGENLCPDCGGVMEEVRFDMDSGEGLSRCSECGMED